MKLYEHYGKHHCDECEEFDYAWRIHLQEQDYPVVTLCKKCLLKLMKEIIER